MNAEFFHQPRQFRKSDFAQRLKELRSHFGYTQQKVVDGVNELLPLIQHRPHPLCRSRYAKWELNNRTEMPDYPELLALCHYFEQEPYYLLTGVNGPRKSRNSQHALDTLYSRWEEDIHFKYVVKMLLERTPEATRKLAELIDVLTLGDRCLLNNHKNRAN
ncbi:hypothetical protein HCH_01543 [Hahella chejuensis KCTC 2396]|uniref:HTH cro/C1-type domain-containing protein n=1 Tax=Hahella chejuensis (strain KCTC 2396) TaxID=349521 RepID=Q2SLS3_HAHCH|nr:helix-turn-helix transcriptional regulator [Hahella chejuensis]ABC28401.1 hypothetical protein HCH_01543 [Hahella chejuensis KCTC 2396]